MSRLDKKYAMARKRRGRGRSSTLLQSFVTLKNKINNEYKNPAEFSLKFMIHSVSDITQNLSVFTMILSVNILLERFSRNIKKFPSKLVRNVTVWTMSELAMDLVYLLVCVVHYKKYWFTNVKGVDSAQTSLYQIFKNWVGQMYPFLFIGVLGVAFLSFYVVFFVVIKVSSPD